jgi:hypothetical protein
VTREPGSSTAWLTVGFAAPSASSEKLVDLVFDGPNLGFNKADPSVDDALTDLRRRRPLKQAEVAISVRAAR